ncbi:PLP-dependent transferase [Shigella flexneri]
MIDNTWAAGVLFKALDSGIDVSISRHQISGWAFRCVIGTAACNARCWEQRRERTPSDGPEMVDADTAYITSRGLRTLRCAFAPTS